MYDNITTIIISYYYSVLNLNLQILNIFKKEDKYFILSYITKDPENIENFTKILKSVLAKNINNLSKDKILDKINLFMNTQIFSNIDKSNYINPICIINKNKIPIDILSLFFQTILYDCIIQIYLNKKIDVKYYSKYNTLILNDPTEILKIFKIINYLRNDIINFYKKTYLSFYVKIVNKIDKHVDYIFPMLIDNSLLMSGIINEKSFEICSEDNECLIVTEKDNENIGGNVELIKNKLQEMSYEPYIKNLYTKSEIEMIENILNNEKLNSLIRQKKLRLSKNFQKILKDISKKNKPIDNLEEYVDEIFIVQDNPDHIDTKKISQILKNNPNSEKFIEYLVDKIVYNEHLNKESSTSEIISLIDSVFDKILNHDYNHNSLNLEDDDIKFILMLETLNALKSDNLPTTPNGNSNIILNIYKDIDSAKINNNEIKLNY